MPDDLKKTARELKQGVRDIARSSPMIAIGEGLSRLGAEVIRRTPAPVRKFGRKLRGEAQSLLGGTSQRGRIRRHQRLRRSQTSKRK